MEDITLLRNSQIIFKNKPISRNDYKIFLKAIKKATIYPCHYDTPDSKIVYMQACKRVYECNLYIPFTDMLPLTLIEDIILNTKEDTLSNLDNIDKHIEAYFEVMNMLVQKGEIV